MTEYQRRPESYIHGLHGPTVTVPARIAEILERHARLNEYRVMVRGRDAELDDVLIALRLVALNWRASATGSTSAPPAEAAAPWLTTTEAARLAHVSDRAIRQAIANKRLKATREGRAWRIARVDLEHYRAARTT